MADLNDLHRIALSLPETTQEEGRIAYAVLHKGKAKLTWLAAMTNEPQQDLYWDDDGNQFNAWLQEQRRGEGWQQTWRDFRQNRWLFQQRLKAVPDRMFLDPQENAPFPTICHCAWSALEHYLDHAAGVRRTIQLPLGTELLTFQGPYSD